MTKIKNMTWSEINWKKCEIHVKKLQESIFKEAKAKNIKRVRKIQNTLLNAYDAKAIAVRRVTQDNRGKRTAGVDGIKTLGDAARMEVITRLSIKGLASPVKRIMIPKPNGKTRPLGIPTIFDRCLQALVKLAIEPEHEANFESNSYGFRPGRSPTDAIKHVYIALRTEAKYVIDADIEKCFDKIDHKKLISLCGYKGKIMKQIEAWLKAGVMDNGVFHVAEKGTPQGGVISPLLANIALDGLQKIVEEWCLNRLLKRNGKTIPKRERRHAMHFNRYADDIRVFYHDLEPLKEILLVINEFLKDRGLNLSEAKTKICHTLIDYNGPKTAGVDYLGFRIKHFHSTGRSSKVSGPKPKKDAPRKNYGIKLLIYPSADKIKSHFEKMRKLAKIHFSKTQNVLIKILAPVMIGWINYFKYSHVSSMTMGKKLNDNLFHLLKAWVIRKHKVSFNGYLYRKYWTYHNNRKSFGQGVAKLLNTRGTNYLPTYQDLFSGYSINKYVMVKSEQSVFDGDHEYWAKQTAIKQESKTRVKLAIDQKHKCVLCGMNFKPDDVLEIDHIIPLKKGGSNQIKNLRLVHGHCHDQKGDSGKPRRASKRKP